jgi:hypothetical protein
MNLNDPANSSNYSLKELKELVNIIEQKCKSLP